MRDRTAHRKERGAVLATIGIAMVLIVGMGAVGVDLARLAFTANEAQVVADASATAGALALRAGQSIETAALSVASENSMDGEPAEAADLDIVVGTYDWPTRQFAPGGLNSNAVSATADREVDNVFAGIFGDATSSVSRSAIAATGPAATGRPTLPVALSDCHFPPDCQDESCLPVLRQTPSTTDNSAYTGFFGNASAGDINGFLHSECGGGGLEGPLLKVGDHISLNNGQVASVLKTLECMVCELGMPEYVVPIITHCDENFVAASPPGTAGPNGLVYGFASITIESFNYANGGVGCGLVSSPRSINLRAVIREEDGFTGAGGPCTGCNLDGITLVR